MTTQLKTAIISTLTGVAAIIAIWVTLVQSCEVTDPTPPPPPPPPVVVDSPSGTFVTGPSGKVRLDGHDWTFGTPNNSFVVPGWLTLKDGVDVGGIATDYLVWNGELYCRGVATAPPNQDWYRWSGTAWTLAPGDPRGPAPPPNSTSFNLSLFGSKTVYAGHDLYFNIWGDGRTGTPENTYIKVINKPAGIVSSLPDFDAGRTCCGNGEDTFMWQTPDWFYTAVKLSIPQNFTPGDYNVTIQLQNSAILQTASYAFKVLAVPDAPVPPTVRMPLGPVPGLAQYQEQMITKGVAQLGDRDKIITNGLWEGSAWYYDGTRASYQIKDYSGDVRFEEYAKNPLDVYKPYVIENDGHMQGYRVFPQGLRMHFERTGDETSKQAALLLKNASYSATGTLTVNVVSETISREVAYAILVMLESEKLGEPRHPRLLEYVDIALGHIDQWFVNEQYTRMAPFMFALTSEALIRYEEVTGDVRVYYALQTGADWIWNHAWVTADKSFGYELEPGINATVGAPDLNLLIVPVYGWLYKKSGDVSYVGKGDQIFEGGVVGAWLDQGKQFVQNYRWSIDYLQWRQ